MEILLFIIAWTLKICLSPVLIIYGILRSIWDAIISYKNPAARKKAADWFKGMALAVDILGNAMGKYIFDDCLRKPGGHSFGTRNETISRAMAYNEQKNTLSGFGKFVAWVLNTCEKDHLKKSLELSKTE